MGKKQATTSTYVSLTKLHHDGETYLKGEKVELTEAQAEQLTKAGVVKRYAPFPGTAATDPADPPTPPNDNTPPVTPSEGSEPQ